MANPTKGTDLRLTHESLVLTVNNALGLSLFSGPLVSPQAQNWVIWKENLYWCHVQSWAGIQVASSHFSSLWRMSRPLLGLRSAQLVHSISLDPPAAGNNSGSIAWFWGDGTCRLSYLWCLLPGFCSHGKHPRQNTFWFMASQSPDNDWTGSLLQSLWTGCQEIPHIQKVDQKRKGNKTPLN